MKRFKKIYIEIGNICNLQCSFCPEVDREKKRLNLEQFTKILESAIPLAERICLHVMGEPLAHPLFGEFVLIAEKKNAPLEITTNGTLLNPENIAALINPAIKQVNFSLQSFFDNFPEANPNSYLKNIFTFTQKALTEYPDLYINYRLWNLAADARKDLLNENLLKKMEEEFSVSINRNIDSRLTKSKKIKGRLYLHYDSRFEWPNPNKNILRTTGTCHGMRSHVAIHANGTVVPCCLDKEANIPLGNALVNPLNEIVNNERAVKIRQGFENGILVEDLCQRCTFATRFKKVTKSASPSQDL